MWFGHVERFDSWRTLSHSLLHEPVEERDLGPFVVPGTGARHWFDRVVDEILDDIPMPASLEVEVRPLRSLLHCQQENLAHDSASGRLAGSLIRPGRA
jgi:hypothetical protein